MTPALRKRHLHTWVLLAIVVPIGFYLALLVIPKIPPGKTIPNPQPQPLENRVRSAENGSFGITANLRAQTQSMVREGTDNGLPSMEDTFFQLEILLTQPLLSPSTLVYLALEPGSNSVEEKLLIGRIGSPGQYRFNLDQLSNPPETLYLIFYDDYHKKVLLEIEL
ncbi:MAG: hypothetical protein SF052_10640 [Bacteroidia bacterium]|nr:hypothetical protein [Bacteroidia bacterium]